MRRTLPVLAAGLAAAAVLWPGASAQPPAKLPPLPPVNPAAARPDTAINGLDGPGFAVAADPDSHLLAAACEGGTVQLWRRDVIMGLRAGDGTASVLGGHQGPVTALAWVPGYRLASGGADRKVLLWQLPQGELLRTLPASAPVRALAAAPDGKRLATAEDAVVQLWDHDTTRPAARLAGPGDWVLCLAFSPDGKTLAAGGYEGKLFAWETASGKKVLDVPARPPAPPAPEGLPDVVGALAFNPDGKEIAAGCADGRVHLLGAADGKVARSLSGHTGAVTALAYHPGGTLLISGSKDGTVRLWDRTNGQSLKTLEGHAAWVQGVVILEKGTRLASVGADQTVRLWDLTPPRP